MTNQELQKKLVGEPIKEYKMPLIKRLAYYRPVLIWLFWSALTAMIVGPTIIANYENFWYYLLLTPLLFFFVMSIISAVKFYAFSAKYHAIITEQAENDSSYENYMGPPGSGKSYTAKEISYAKSQFSWEERQFEYWLLLDKLTDENYKPTDEEKEIIDAYQFTIQNEGIPLYATSIPVYSERYKRFSYELKLEHLKQQLKLPFGIRMFQDEIGTAINFMQAWDVYSKEGCNAAQFDDFFRLIRQLLEAGLIGTEQDAANIAIFARRVAADNKRFDRKQWVLKPRFLFWVYTKLKKHFIKKMRVSQSKRYAKFMRLFKIYIFNCGFFKFVYKSQGNLVTNGKTEVVIVNMKEKQTCFYFPRASEVNYDTRAFANGYLPKEQEIDLKVFNARKLTREQVLPMLKSVIVKKRYEEKERKRKEEEEAKKREKAEEKNSENLAQKKENIAKKKSTDDVLPF